MHHFPLDPLSTSSRVASDKSFHPSTLPCIDRMPLRQHRAGSDRLLLMPYIYVALRKRSKAPTRRSLARAWSRHKKRSKNAATYMQTWLETVQTTRQSNSTVLTSTVQTVLKRRPPKISTGEANTTLAPQPQGGTLPATDPQAAHGSRVLRTAASRAEVVERKQGG